MSQYYIKTWVSNQRPAATFVNCVHTIKITQYLRPLSKLLFFFHMRPANQHTIRAWPFAIKKLETHASQ